MNNRIAVLLIACCNVCSANALTSSDNDPATFKDGVAQKTPVISLAHYNDAKGEHTLMLTTWEVAAKSGTRKSIDLTAVSLGKNGVEEWTIRDGAECPADSATTPTFYPNPNPVTDLNNDGEAEVTVAYSLSCGARLEPAEIKVIMRQGEKKYAIRGQALVYEPGQPLRGGIRKPDAALLLPGNAAFLNHMGNIWNKVSRHFGSGDTSQSPLQALEGNYNLQESPDKEGYAKAHISITKLDDRHVIIQLACEWKHAPKAACHDYFVAQWRDDGVYLQETNTAVTRMFFSPNTHEIAVAQVSVDGKDLYKVDSFSLTSGPPSDATLARRLQGVQKISVDPVRLGRFSNRIEFVSATP